MYNISRPTNTHCFLSFEPPHGKTDNLRMRKTKTQISFAVTAKLISVFVFATRIVQFLFYLNPKFQASSSFLCLYRLVCVRPVRKPHCWFFHEVAHSLAYFPCEPRVVSLCLALQVSRTRLPNDQILLHRCI